MIDLDQLLAFLSLRVIACIRKVKYINENCSHLCNVMPQTIPLNDSPNGFIGLIAHIEGDVAFKKKLMSLGIRKDQQITVLHQRQGGVVVLSKGSRVALDANIAAKILLLPLPQSTAQTELQLVRT
ncbi:MAG: FeoA family protein [Gammaproteobacteria bacterium]|nr:FeoA family protein [Gammaproteobacteria bacterium]